MDKNLIDNEIYVTIHRHTIGSDEWVFSYSIEYLPKEYWDAKRRAPYFVYIKDTYSESAGGTYDGGWSDYDEAVKKGIEKGYEVLTGQTAAEYYYNDEKADIVRSIEIDNMGRWQWYKMVLGNIKSDNARRFLLRKADEILDDFGWRTPEFKAALLQAAKDYSEEAPVV